MNPKRVEQWARERTKLKRIYQQKGITTCEVKLEKCMRSFGLSFHHRKKRVEYYKCPEELGEFSETLLTCAFCHDCLEKDKELTKKVFNKLR